jgi:hypothetical protein
MSPSSPSQSKAMPRIVQVAARAFAPLLVALILGLWLYTRFFSLTPEEEHAQSPSDRGGILIGVADGRYHVEALVEQGGIMRLFMLGQSAGEIIDVEMQTLNAYVNTGQFSVTSLALEPDPQTGDRRGYTSQFVGRLPADFSEGPLRLTISGLRIGAERFQFGLAWAEQPFLAVMPPKIEDDEERRLYLMAGGLYSESDITANGGLTASEKFVGFKAQHDLDTRPGDPLCPITRTKANPECAWTIGGRRYEFCCPPCIDEFVRQAKEQPDQIQPPEAYVR